MALVLSLKRNPKVLKQNLKTESRVNTPGVIMATQKKPPLNFV